jgi:hypothetical protein
MKGAMGGPAASDLIAVGVVNRPFFGRRDA